MPNVLDGSIVEHYSTFITYIIVLASLTYYLKCLEMLKLKKMEETLLQKSILVFSFILGLFNEVGIDIVWLWPLLQSKCCNNHTYEF